MRGDARREKGEGGIVPFPAQEEKIQLPELDWRRRGEGVIRRFLPPAHCCLLPIWVLRRKVKRKKKRQFGPQKAGRRVICAEDPTLPEQRWGVITLYMQEEEEETRKGERMSAARPRCGSKERKGVSRNPLLLHSLPKEPKAQDRWPKLESLRHPSEEGGKWALNKLCTRLGCWPDFLLGGREAHYCSIEIYSTAANSWKFRICSYRGGEEGECVEVVFLLDQMNKVRRRRRRRRSVHSRLARS